MYQITENIPNEPSKIYPNCNFGLKINNLATLTHTRAKQTNQNKKHFLIKRESTSEIFPPDFGAFFYITFRISSVHNFLRKNMHRGSKIQKKNILLP
jgi:hypothetical protein